MNTPAPAIHTAPARTILSVSGPEARAFLQRVITADVETLQPGQCRPGGLLTPQGKLAVDFLLFADGDTVWLDVPAGAADALAKRLSMFKLRAKAEIVINTDLAALWSEHPFEGSAPDPRLGDKVHRGIGEEAGDAVALDALEVRHGIPAFGRDYGEAEVFPTDVNLDVYGGIGWKKGCFIGQEVVSRMKRRGTIRKRSLCVNFSGEAPSRGTPVTAGTATLGEITSSQGHHAIALIRLDRMEAASETAEAGGQPARIDLPDNLRPEAPAEKV
ncbi:YgfZ/GcvT domain-containing protein [Maricaulis sp.]|uniref:CAF17-like 4Fe-4S cluster assembly/insertion protein YgfZ n=1 Tax=Maricaulis sp. TaxID=1486257 RepID=UPI003A90EF92